MKNSLLSAFAFAFLAASATSASAQTLGTAANYDIFIQNGGSLKLKDANQLFGDVGISNKATLDGGKTSSTFDGTIFRHTGAGIVDGGGLNPSGGIQSSAAINAALNQANIDLNNYVTYLNGLSATQSYGNFTSVFSFSSTMSQTVLDFTTLNLDNDSFTLTGRAGGDDVFIIRVSDQFEFRDTDVTLNNVAVDNVIWYFSSNSGFELHKSDLASNPNEFQKFFGTVIAPNSDKARIGEVDFTGKVYATTLEMGSGFIFQVPEPASSLMLLVGAGGLLLRRRRNH
jgi:hypothetical protein